MYYYILDSNISITPTKSRTFSKEDTITKMMNS